MTRDAASSTAGRSRALRLAEAMLGLLVAILLFAMMAVTIVDVFGRYVLSRPLPGAFELTEIMLAMTIFIGLPLVCIREEHVAIALLTDRLPAGPRELHTGIVSLIGAAVLGVVAWQLLAHAGRLASYGEVTVFLGIPKALLGYAMAGFAVLAALALVLIVVDHFARARTTPSAAPARSDD